MNWTISQRIAAGFAGALVLVLAVGVLGVWALTQVDAAATRAIESERVSLVNGLEVNSQMRASRGAFLSYIVGLDEEQLTERDSAVSAAHRALDALDRSGGDASARWRNVRTLLEEYDATVDDAIRAYQAGDRTLGEQIRLGRARPARLAMNRGIEQAIAADLQEVDAIIAEADRTARNSRNAILFGLVLIIVVGAVIGRWLAGTIGRPLRATSAVLGSSAAQILAATTQQATGATETLAAVTETAATVDEVAQTAEQAAEQAQVVAETARHADEIARRGRGAVENSAGAMTRIESQVDSIGESIVKLTEQAQAIGEIMTTVTDLAEQTNLLALNAAIEAARAGEQGRGFAVVAGEVRTLAEQSKQATVRVRQILSEVQSATSAVVMVTEQGSKEAREGTRLVGEAGETIRLLTEAVTNAAQAAAQIAASTGEQKTGVGQIREAIHNIREAAQQNLSATRQAEAASRDLNQLGNELMTLVGTQRETSNS